eukprot:TRINITY_DN5500_c0_g2_i1.p1 TRINITY_DN5500_c0_g2~~TRINITY_DN5500_c0_g2_i1.p1  ORF type:complete len:188 (-),score=8.89 TRINITY_DN5500_c0_g2_i1:236-799(-)
MAVFRIEDGPDSDDFEFDTFSVAYSMSWPSSDPPADEVPTSALTNPTTRQSQGAAEQRNVRGQDTTQTQTRHCRNPLPSSGSRRDACGSWTVGSDGHEMGLCNGPCKDLRSGRGCTYGTKCNRCHFPHPEVSSTSLRSRNSRARRADEWWETAQQSAYATNVSMREQSDTRAFATSQSRSRVTTISL